MTIISKSLLLTISFTVVVAATGCGKKQPPAQTATAADITTATSTAAPPLNAIIIPETAAGDSPQVLASLTQALRKYVVENKRMPQNFSEMVNAGYVRNLPAPPPGKQFGIDAKTTRIILINQ